MSELRTPPPPPALYHGKSFADYLGWKAVNSGVLKWGLITPAHFAAAFDGKIDSEDSPDRLMGRAIHCAILEPESFDERFIVSGNCAAILGKSAARAGLACGATASTLGTDGKWYCGMHDKSVTPQPVDAEIITADQKLRALAVKNALHQLPVEIRESLARPGGYSEVSGVWEEYDLPCKLRLDRGFLQTDGPDRPLILDVKKTQVGKASREDCRKAIKNYRYDIQQAWYRRGIETHIDVRPDFWWIFVEDNYPFGVNIVRADDVDYSIGIQDALLSLRRYATRKDNPPNYIEIPEQITDGGLPASYRQLREEQAYGNRTDRREKGATVTEEPGGGGDWEPPECPDGDSSELDG